jgi:hypothetical protein
LVFQLGSGQPVSLMNAGGINVLQKYLNAGLHTIDVSHLPKGSYFFKAGSINRQISIL